MEFRRVLFRSQLPHRSQPGNNAKTLPSGNRLNGGIALIKKLNIAPEFIDKKGLYHGRVARVDYRLGARDSGDLAAAVDVAHQSHRHVGPACQAHVCAVPFTQVDFGWASSALVYDDTRSFAQPALGRKDGIQPLTLPTSVILCSH